VVGGGALLDEAARTRGIQANPKLCATVEEASAVFGDALPYLDAPETAYSPGTPTEEGAAVALHSLAEATRFALLDQASAVVTAPVSKAQLAEVGFEYPGQTEFLADVCGLKAEDAVMMLAGPSLKAVPLTVHVALADVAGMLTAELIAHKARITAAALQRDFGIAKPRIAIAGLNPHAGEDGKFGSEEAAIIAPAIDILREEGIDATGPHPADALFAPRARAGYDAALCMYHDQALIPVKALDFDQGVNVTLGLPIIRTSPDHGTAFDIAGKNIADPGAMIAAIKMAGECAMRRANG
jgi:4-hydroxythreonine-4-phosphate dehydrogenase